MKTDTTPKLIYKRDIFGIILVLFVVTICMLIRMIPADTSGKKFAEISVDGNVAIRMEINHETERSEIPIDNGYDTVVVYENGEIGIQSCKCKEQICVHMGRISNVGTSIVCLPARTVISIVNEDSSNTASTDAVTY